MKLHLKNNETYNIRPIKYLHLMNHKWAIHRDTKGGLEETPIKQTDYFTVSHYKTGLNACPYRKLSLKEMVNIFTEYITNIGQEKIKTALNGKEIIN